MKHNFQRYETSIRDIKRHLALVNFEVSIMPSRVVEEWNGLESSHPNSLCQVAWDFFINFQNKPCLAPHLILSDRSRCLIPHQGLLCAFLFHPTSNGFFLWSCRYGGYESKLVFHILLSQKPDPKAKQVINLDQDVQMCKCFFLVDGG